jgi:hypothetical protein
VRTCPFPSVGVYELFCMSCDCGEDLQELGIWPGRDTAMSRMACVGIWGQSKRSAQSKSTPDINKEVNLGKTTTAARGELSVLS